MVFALCIHSICLSQQTINTTPKVNKSISIALLGASVLLNAAGEGLISTNHKFVGNSLKGLSVATILSIPFLTEVNKKRWLIYCISYASFTIALRQPMYNLSRGEHYKKPNTTPEMTMVYFTTVAIYLPLKTL